MKSESSTAATLLAVSAKQAAAMVGVSTRTWWRLASAEKVPESFMLGGRRLWRVSDLERFVRDGFRVTKD